MMMCHDDESCYMQRPTASSNPTDTSQDDVSVSEVTEVQAAVDLVQKQMRIYDGSFLQFRCDEKGFLSICAFGLPGKTHEDSPARAIQVHRLPVKPVLMVNPKHMFSGKICCTRALYRARSASETDARSKACAMWENLLHQSVVQCTGCQ